MEETGRNWKVRLVSWVNSQVNSLKHIVLFFMAALLLTQCGIKRAVTTPEAPVANKLPSSSVGIEGFRALCLDQDTINTILIRKADALFISNDERYETVLNIYAIRDSLIYMSAVNSGFEILRAVVNQDSIIVIDRLNKVVYTSPVIKRFGYQNPVNFEDIQNLISRYYLCDKIEEAREIDFTQLGFEFNEAQIKKSIILNRESLLMDSFEFVHSQTKSYFMGERDEEGFKIYSNFMVNEFEVHARGGTLSYNRTIEVKMDINRKKYTFVNF